jgi:hypothetical protein
MKTTIFGFAVATQYGDPAVIRISDNCNEDNAAVVSVDEVDLLIEKLREAKDEILANAETATTEAS